MEILYIITTCWVYSLPSIFVLILKYPHDLSVYFQLVTTKHIHIIVYQLQFVFSYSFLYLYLIPNSFQILKNM
jgi:hypothetical protein